MQNTEIRDFWISARADLERTPMSESITELSPADPLVIDAHVRTRTVYEVTLTSVGNTRIRGWYVVPAGQPPAGGWPAIMELPPYRETVPLPLHLAMYGFATLSLFPRGQSISRKESEVDLERKVIHNILTRDSYYYRGAYLDCVRGIDFLSRRSEVNASRIGTWGFSAGGGLSLVSAALDSRVKASVAGVPWPCDFERGADASTFPFVHIRNYLQEHPSARRVALETLKFFDVINLTSGISCPVLIGGAIEDPMHPIESTLKAYERIPSKKSTLIYPDLNHEYKTDFTFNGLVWMKRHL